MSIVSVLPKRYASCGCAVLYRHTEHAQTSFMLDAYVMSLRSYGLQAEHTLEEPCNAMQISLICSRKWYVAHLCDVNV